MDGVFDHFSPSKSGFFAFFPEILPDNPLFSLFFTFFVFFSKKKIKKNKKNFTKKVDFCQKNTKNTVLNPNLLSKKHEKTQKKQKKNIKNYEKFLKIFEKTVKIPNYAPKSI